MLKAFFFNEKEKAKIRNHKINEEKYLTVSSLDGGGGQEETKLCQYALFFWALW